MAVCSIAVLSKHMVVVLGLEEDSSTKYPKMGESTMLSGTERHE